VTSDLIDQIPDLERQADEFERKAHAIRQIIAGVRALNGEAGALLMRRQFASHRIEFETAPLATVGPRGPQAVLTVMRERPDHEWKVVEIKQEMLRRGWAPTPKAVEASVAKLRGRGRIEVVRYGYYKLAADPSGDGEAAADGLPA
jgi:hypothetical protein